MNLTSVKIVTRNVPALAEFYGAVTGMSGVGSEDYMVLRRAGVVLAICSERAIDLFDAGAASAAANRSIILNFEVPDVDAERRRLEAIVRTFVQEPADRPWGERVMLFRDPDGNLINFFAPRPDRLIFRTSRDGPRRAEKGPPHETDHGNETCRD